MSTTEQTANRDKVEFIRLGYDVSMEFRVQVSDLETFKAVVRAAGRYNRFDAEELIAALEPVFPEIEGVEFGREYSPVLYVNLPYWTHQKIGAKKVGGGERLTAEELDTLGAQVIEALKSAKADEIGWVRSAGLGDGYFDERGSMTWIRAWWD